jgi:hypothetical protein
MLDSIVSALPRYAGTEEFKDAADIQKFDAILTEILNMKHQLNQSQNELQNLSQYQMSQSEKAANELKILEEKCIFLQMKLEDSMLIQATENDRADSLTSARISIEILIREIQSSLANHMVALQSASTANSFVESERNMISQCEESFADVSVDAWYSGIKTQLDSIQRALCQANYLGSKANNELFPTSTKDVIVIPTVLSNPQNHNAICEETLIPAFNCNSSSSDATELENQLLILTESLQRANSQIEKLESALLTNKLKSEQRAECAIRNLQSKTDEFEGQIHALKELNSRHELRIKELISRLCSNESLSPELHPTFDFEAIDVQHRSDEPMSLTTSSVLFNFEETLHQHDANLSPTVDLSQSFSQVEVQAIKDDTQKILIQRLEASLRAATNDCAVWKRLSRAALSAKTLYDKDTLQTELSQSSELNFANLSAECDHWKQKYTELQKYAHQLQEHLPNCLPVLSGDFERPDEAVALQAPVTEVCKIAAKVEASQTSGKQGTRPRNYELEKDSSSESLSISLEASVHEKLTDPLSSNIISAWFRRCQTFSAEYFAVQVGLGYKHMASSGLALHGCANDVQSFASFFREHSVKFTSHLVCSDEVVDVECTQMLGGALADILCALKMTKDAMDRSVAKEKYLFFNFSGHGTQVVDLDGDEEDGFDEALCPNDFDVSGSLTDDVLCRWLESLPAHRLFAVCDCCHSGTTLDLGEFEGFFASGCRDDECAADALDSGGKTGGALTMMLLNALNGSDCSVDLLQRRIEANCAIGEFVQRPVLQCTSSSVLLGWGTTKEENLAAQIGSEFQKTDSLRTIKQSPNLLSQSVEKRLNEEAAIAAGLQPDARKSAKQFLHEKLIQQEVADRPAEQDVPQLMLPSSMLPSGLEDLERSFEQVAALQAQVAELRGVAARVEAARLSADRALDEERAAHAHTLASLEQATTRWSQLEHAHMRRDEAQAIDALIESEESRIANSAAATSNYPMLPSAQLSDAGRPTSHEAFLRRSREVHHSQLQRRHGGWKAEEPSEALEAQSISVVAQRELGATSTLTETAHSLVLFELDIARHDLRDLLAAKNSEKCLYEDLIAGLEEEVHRCHEDLQLLEEKLSDAQQADEQVAALQAQVAELRGVAARVEAARLSADRALDEERAAHAHTLASLEQATTRWSQLEHTTHEVRPLKGTPLVAVHVDNSDILVADTEELPMLMQSDVQEARIEDLTRALSQSRSRAAEFSKSFRDMKASFVSAQNHFAICKQNCAEECSSLRLAASRLASQKVALTNELSLLKNSYIKLKDAAIAAQDKVAFEKLSIIQERDVLAIKVVHLSKDLEQLRSSFEGIESQRFLFDSVTSPHVSFRSIPHLQVSESSLIELSHQSSDHSTETQVEVKDQVDQAFAASQRHISELRERVNKLEAILNHERGLHSDSASRLTQAEFSMENMKLQLRESNASIGRKVSEYNSIMQQNFELQNLSEESEIRLQDAMTQIQELIAEKICLQQNNSQLKIDLFEMRERISSLEGMLQVCDSSHSLIEKLRIDRAALMKELEDLELSAQKQVDSWQVAAAVAKREAHELNITIHNLVRENQLLYVSLENKVSIPPCSLH